jgi:hypothetical protein
VIRVRGEFGIGETNELPPLGSASRELRILQETWNAARTALTLDVSGMAGHDYELSVWNADQISSVEGAKLSKVGKLQIRLPSGEDESYMRQQVVIHLVKQ